MSNADEGVRRKLIEVALPLDAINAASAKEKSIRHGHPSTLHLWWARRPLAACRAVLFAQLVDDPSAHPEQFPTVEAQDAERDRLFGILEDLVRWENTTNDRVLEAARAEIRASCDGDPPPVLDPFAGGGSIPLEAQRLGLEAHASDLNPVAVLINKALIELPPKFADQAPVHPDAEARTRWHGAQGLAEDVRRYGAWMRDQAQQRIGHHYPTATLPDGSKATVIAWIWARTVACPNPACGAVMPLVRSFWLGKKKGKEAWARAIPGDGGVRFEIGHDPGGPPIEGTVGRSGATCVTCGETAPLSHVRSEGQAGRIGAQLMATVAQGDRRRTYLAPSVDHETAANIDRPTDVPDTALPDQALGFRVQAYGMTHHADLFTNRQLLALTTLTDLVTEARQQATDDARTAGLADDQATAYADAIATYLGLTVSRLADSLNALASWSSARDQSRNLFTRQAIPMVWDFAEVSPFGGAAGDLDVSAHSVARSTEGLPALQPGAASNTPASLGTGSAKVTSTDPPYYDNIGYADLADFFYVWLRRSLRDVHPELFSTMVTPKADELVADPFRFNGEKEKAKAFFEEGFVRTFANARRHHAADAPLTLFYAFRQAESSTDDGLASTGWETLLGGLLEAGWSVTATWPMRTERGQRMRSQASNALASSVVLACRPRPETAGVTDRRGFLQTLKSELPGSLRAMQAANIAPVDLPQAAIGPGMAVFSRYAKVVEPSGDAMRVRTALGLINEALAEVLDEQEGDFDPDTRWAIKWFDQHGHQPGPSGQAEGLCTAYNTSLRGLVEAGIVEAHGGQTRLLERSELNLDWDPASDARVPVWEATQHLVKRLEEGGDQPAAALLRDLGGVGDSARLLAYRLFNLCERKDRARLAGPYNALAVAWPELARIAATQPGPVQGTLGS